MKTKPRAKTVAQLSKWEKNPRTITDARKEQLLKTLRKFGDLSGFVYNVRNKRLVGGHMRAEHLAEAEIKIVQKLTKPSKQGSVAYGYAVHNGERYSYREVSWDDEMHAAAAVAANRSAGDWEWQGLKEILADLEEEEFDLSLTGFDRDEIDNILGAADMQNSATPDYSVLEGASEQGLDELASGVKRAIQIEFNIEDYQEAADLVKFWRDRGAYVGSMLVEKLNEEKAKL